MAAKPSIPKGTRDFSPVEMAKRNYIFNTIRDVYHLYGFQQIETPSMEMLSTLMGKYGEEGDKLLFKIQNSGDYFSGLTDEELLSRNAAKLASKFCEKGLRYDLTVPFARYVVMHRDEITFLSSVTRFSQCGVPTVRRRGVIVSSINAMPMWWAATPC